MARSALLALIALSPVISQNATRPDVDRKQVEWQEAVNRLLNRAHTLPPEFAADILLKVAESRLVPDKSLKRELIDEVFNIARNVQRTSPRLGSSWPVLSYGVI